MPSASVKTARVDPVATSTGLFATPGRRNVILSLVLVVATLALYNPVTRNPFVNYDDDRYVTDNPHIRAGLNWKTIIWAFRSTEASNWHPLTWLSHALDYQLFRLGPSGHHYTNVLLHALNVVLLFLLLQRATGFTGRSFMVAALFALHPINVESVAWISERKNLLSMFFFLLALGAYARYACKPAAGRYVVVALLFACGLMAKPMVITLPFVLLLWDYWPLRRMGFAGREFSSRKASAGPMTMQGVSRLAWEKLPLLTLSAASAAITMKVQSAGGAVRSAIEVPLSARFGNAVVCYARYVERAFWPSRLAPMYPHPENSLNTWQVIVAFSFLLVVTALVIAARRRSYLLVGWFWFLGTLVPMIGLVQVGAQAMADRYAYLPFLGLFIMVCWGATEWLQQRRAALGWLAVPGVVAVLALTAVTHRQIGYWRDNATLWSRALQVTSNNFVAEDNLGGALLAAGRTEEAMRHFQAAVEIKHLDPVANLNLAAYQQQQGNLPRAIELYQRVLRMTTDALLQSTVFTNLGFAYRDLGDYNRAKESYESAIRAAPDDTRAMIGMGVLAQKSGDLAQAIDQYSRAVAVQPTDVGYLLLAHAFQQRGQTTEAQTAYQAAKRLSPDMDQAQQEANRLLSK